MGTIAKNGGPGSRFPHRALVSLVVAALVLLALVAAWVARIATFVEEVPP